MAMIVDREKCIGCESCVAVCPVGAISMADGKALIDAESCISCGACVGECPVEAISAAAVENKKEVTNNEGKDMWVITELENGEPLGVAYELLAVTRELCAKAGETCCAVVVAAEAGDVPQKLIAAGADKVYVIADAKYADYNTDLYTDAICQLVKEYKPSALMLGATVDGRDLAPRIAARLSTGLCADCTSGSDWRSKGMQRRIIHRTTAPWIRSLTLAPKFSIFNQFHLEYYFSYQSY